MNTNEQEKPFSTSIREPFGCCSRYAACSDAKACLIPDRDYSKYCNYRKSLEQEIIFYGKNANKFNAAVYQSFVDNYNALPADAAELLRGILYYSFIKKRGTKLIMLADSPDISVLDRVGYFSQVERPDIVVRKCSMAAMLDACGSLIETANEWARVKVDPDKWEKRRNVKKGLPGVKITREELSAWIIQFSPETMKQLSEGISFVQLDLSKTIETEEFFIDCIYKDGVSFALNTLENDPRFLSQ